MDYENMTEEFMELLHDVLEDVPADEAFAMTCLANLRPSDFTVLANQARYRLEEMGRCPHCGCKLRYKVYYESHPEIAYRVDSMIFTPQEKMAFEYCPNCEPDKGDFDGQDFDY
jgi:hypothetical protein